jgi:hypothetical protein
MVLIGDVISSLMFLLSENGTFYFQEKILKQLFLDMSL